MSCSCVKDIRLDRISKRRGQRVLMVLKFCVELMEGAFAQFMVALYEKRAQGTLGQRFLTPSLIDQHAELHVHICQLRKGVVVTAKRDAAQREKAFLGHGKHMRLHPANLV